MSPKVGKIEFSWISRRVRIGFLSCLDLHMHYCATVSASSFQVLIYSGWRNSTLRSFIRFLVGPARRTNVKSNWTPKIEETLEASNYDAKPWFFHFAALNSKCSGRFWAIDPEIFRTCLMCPCRAFYDLFIFSAGNVGSTVLSPCPMANRF